jgi:hypothetical protein
MLHYWKEAEMEGHVTWETEKKCMKMFDQKT